MATNAPLPVSPAPLGFSSPPKRKVAVIGLGRMGRLHASCWSPFGELVGICDPAEEAQRFASAQQLPAFPDVASLLETVQPDIVSICTPPALHASAAQLCLERPQTFVLCEKPLATSFAEGQQLIHPRVQMAAKFRHFAAIQTVRRLLQEQAIGELASFRIDFLSRMPYQGTWFSDPALSGGGVIMDNGPHALDLVRYLFSPIARLHAFAPPCAGVETSALLALQTQSGVPGAIYLSWEAPSPSDTFLTIHGSEGSIEVGWQSSRLRRGSETTNIAGAWDKVQAHAEMFSAFAAWAAGQAEPYITPDELEHCLFWTDAAYRSLRSN